MRKFVDFQGRLLNQTKNNIRFSRKFDMLNG
jgi:hypothetical protein